jgi:cell wall-associated NlpC family hydrolase
LNHVLDLIADSVKANGDDIVKAARYQIGVPYSYGGGGKNGKSTGINEGAHTVGFDCSGLAQYAVYKGTGKVIKRTADAQYVDPNCKKVAYASRKPGDLVFFPGHVGVVSSFTKMIDAPHTGAYVREESIWSYHKDYVRRCW